MSFTGNGLTILHDLNKGKVNRVSTSCYGDISAATTAGGASPLYFIASTSGSIALGDLRTTNKNGNCLFQLERCHTGKVNTLYNMKSRDYVLISSGMDGYLKLFDLRYPCKMQQGIKENEALPFSTFRLAKEYSDMNFSVSPDERVISVAVNEEVLICSLESQICVNKTCNVESGNITKTQFSDNSSILFISFLDNNKEDAELVAWLVISKGFVTWQAYSLPEDANTPFYDDLNKFKYNSMPKNRKRFNDKRLSFTLMGEHCVVSTTHSRYHFLDTFDGRTGKLLSTTASLMNNFQQVHLLSHPSGLLISSHYNTETGKYKLDESYIKLLVQQMVDQ